MTKFYFGKVCAKHPELKGKRYSSNRNCVLCQSEKAKKWKKANPERELENARTWRAANPEYNRALHRESQRKWRAANPEYNRALQREWKRERSAKRWLDSRISP